MSELRIKAENLQPKHIGMEAYLPGAWDKNHKLQNTWAPITLIQFRKDRMIKVRRYPDGHVDHTLRPDDEILLRKAQSND